MTDSVISYLKKYEITLSVMQTAAALERIAYEFVLDAAAEGLRYVEVRYSPLLHRPALTLAQAIEAPLAGIKDRKSTRLNSSHLVISYAVFCLKKKKTNKSDSQLAA